MAVTVTDNIDQMKTVNTGIGRVALTRAELQRFRLALRAKLDEIERELLEHLPPKVTRGLTPRQRQLLLRGFVRRVAYGHED